MQRFCCETRARDVFKELINLIYTNSEISYDIIIHFKP